MTSKVQDLKITQMLNDQISSIKYKSYYDKIYSSTNSNSVPVRPIRNDLQTDEILKAI